MQYDAIILELLDRIKQLETHCNSLSNRISFLEEQQIPEEPQEEAITSGPDRQKMTQTMIDACYVCGRQLFQDDTLPFNQAVAQLTEQTGINYASAVIYVYAVINMLKGETYKRAINQSATKQYLQRILEDYGKPMLAKALAATKGHIAYRERCGHKVSGLIQISNDYEAKL